MVKFITHHFLITISLECLLVLRNLKGNTEYGIFEIGMDKKGEIDNLSKIAKLPTKDEAISMLMGVMKMPIEKLVRTVAAPHTKLVQTLFAYSNSKASN